jgi:branched-chain amino acid aminotransferase
MQPRIQIQPVAQSRINTVDFSNIPFGKIFSDHMFLADYDGSTWSNFRIVPFGYVQMHPSNLAIHYGQSIFEGMKATKLADGQPTLFRPELHSERLNRSASRMMMPTFPEDIFLEAIHCLVELDAAWIPTDEGSSLYIRPFMYATDESIGVRPSTHYTFSIITGPVGPYYNKAVRLFAEEHYIRAASGGVGDAKTSGNYAASMFATQQAIAKGYDQVLWLDAKEFEYVQEVGTMNIFFVIDNKVVTPNLSGTILPGITRACTIEMLRDAGHTVEERPLSMFEILDAYRSGRLQECFGTGTAAVVTHVSAISWRGEDFNLPAVENRPIGSMIKDTINGLRSGRIADTKGWLVPVQATVSI